MYLFSKKSEVRVMKTSVVDPVRFFDRIRIRILPLSTDQIRILLSEKYQSVSSLLNV
jgi:hypothetical protein